MGQMRPPAVKRYFDDTAKNYAAAYEHTRDLRSFIFQERKKIVFELFDVTHGTVLDIGCGPAVHTDRLTQLGCTVYGVDVSEEMISIARSKQFPKTTFLIGTIERLPFEGAAFDAVLCSGVLEYLENTEAAIREIVRVTKPRGTVIVTVPNGLSWLNKLDLGMRQMLRFAYERLRIRALQSAMTHGYRPRYFSPKKLERLFAQQGLAVEECRSHVFRLSFLNKIWPRLSLWVAQRMNFVSSPYWGINVVIRARKV